MHSIMYIMDRAHNKAGQARHEARVDTLGNLKVGRTKKTKAQLASLFSQIILNPH